MKIGTYLPFRCMSLSIKIQWTILRIWNYGSVQMSLTWFFVVVSFYSHSNCIASIEQWCINVLDWIRHSINVHIIEISLTECTNKRTNIVLQFAFDLCMYYINWDKRPFYGIRSRYMHYCHCVLYLKSFASHTANGRRFNVHLIQ